MYASEDRSWTRQSILRKIEERLMIFHSQFFQQPVIITKLKPSFFRKPRTHWASLDLRLLLFRLRRLLFITKRATCSPRRACCHWRRQSGSTNSEFGTEFTLTVSLLKQINECLRHWIYCTQIPGRDKDAVRTYYERAWTWKAPTEPVKSVVHLFTRT